MIAAALYIDTARGPYVAMGMDCWGIERDATRLLTETLKAEAVVP